ncbi:adenylate kinase 4, mitochondrial isoform X1 [Epinephelus lanceolatus]|uniref:adenylate kinase 4, mitochondrial isoform X1 n=2 Tax=Epinephelus lanceolatus TaxID=310571 RepID=UPI0014472A09|nr:adenylate kinase 4, mitochondrial isoform X1 [Epinephelus lanceolatus]
MAKLFRAAIMGPPGSGKGTISQRIAQSFGLVYLSSGHFLRESIAANTEAGLMVKTYVDRSMLVPDDVMTRLMLPRLQQMIAHSWLLDGFPRTLSQAQALNNICQMDLVISLNIPYETLRERLSDRWIHPTSGRVYNMGFNPPRVKGKDDITGEPLIQHDDDKPEALMARLRHYKDVAKPVIDLYKSQGILHSFSGTETDRIWPYINSLLITKMDTQPSDAFQTQTP